MRPILCPMATTNGSRAIEDLGFEFVVAGANGAAAADDGGVAFAGDDGSATAGAGGEAHAGYEGAATAGNGGTAIAGDRGTAIAGDGGTAIAGAEGAATAGADGIVCVRWWDAAVARWRIAIGYAGEAGIEAGVAYCVRDGILVRRDA